MRVIGKDFHDYYDSVQGLGFDPTIVYLRKPVDEDCEKNGYPFRVFNNRWRSGNLTISNHVIGFCGLLYTLFKFTKDVPFGEDPITKICWNVDDIDTFIFDNFRDKEVDIYLGDYHRYDRRWLYPHHDQFEEHFTRFMEERANYRNLFLSHKCPIFVSNHPRSKFRYNVIWNGSLKEFEFFRIKEPYTAFQEIEHYIGGVLTERKEVPEMSDEVKAAQHGFDKFSFRKDKKKK